MRIAWLEVEPRCQAEGAWLVGQEEDPRAGAALAVEGQQSALVSHVVDEERHVPVLATHTEAQVDKIVGRQLGIVSEGALGQWTADGVGCER